MNLLLLCAQYQEADDDPTMPSLQPYLEHEVPTEPVLFTREECIEEARDRARLGSHEAEAYWLLMAAGCDAE